MATDTDRSTRVTIAIPTYNRAGRFLRSAIECALAQTYPNVEILVADNCSTDATPEVVQSYSDPRIRYLRHPTNIGANSNFNACIRAASGEYFLLLPDDDLIDPDMVEACMSAAKGETGFGIIRTGTRLLDGSGSLIRELPNRAAGLDYAGFFRGWMRGQFTSYVCSTLFNTRLLREVGGLQSHHGLFQDLMAVAKLVARAGHRDVLEVKAGFRRHDANYGSAAEIRAWCEDGVQLAETIRDEAPTDGEALYQESMRYLCRTVYGYATNFLDSPLERLRAYRLVHVMFGRCYPPWRFVVERYFGRRFRAVVVDGRRLAKKILR
jgi:glycosyltransferase involved in cell wall biosynthesis